MNGKRREGVSFRRRIVVKLPHHGGLKRQRDALSDPFSEVFSWQIVVGS
jgi:hypothetical protein